jgi:hypothetical protein
MDRPSGREDHDNLRPRDCRGAERNPDRWDQRQVGKFAHVVTVQQAAGRISIGTDRNSLCLCPPSQRYRHRHLADR